MDTPVTGTPRLLLRFEGLAVLVAAVLVFRELDASWWLFWGLFLVPDVALIGYLAGPRVGAAAYNALHTYLAPAAVAAVVLVTGSSAGWPICLIWLAHIGMDRTLGLGLKYPASFRETHLGGIGRGADAG